MNIVRKMRGNIIRTILSGNRVQQYALTSSPLTSGKSYRNVALRFWPRNVSKRGVCYQNVCPSVCLSVTLVSHA